MRASSQGNIILSEAMEAGEASEKKATQRLLGMILIPAKYRVSCEVDENILSDEQLQALTV